MGRVGVLKGRPFQIDEKYRDKYIYVTEYLLSNDGNYIKQDNLFSGQYLIEN